MLFLTLALVHLIALISPGPDFFFVSQIAISRSRREAMMAMIGISLGIVLWAGIVLMGLHLMLKKVTWLHQAIIIGGGIYLCCMGLQLLFSPRIQNMHLELETVPQIALRQARHSFLRGLVTNLSNPKSVIYFGSVFSLFISDNISTGTRWGLLLMIVTETVAWFSLVAIIFSLPVMRRSYQRLSAWIDRMAGVLFIGFGLHIMFAR